MAFSPRLNIGHTLPSFQLSGYIFDFIDKLKKNFNVLANTPTQFLTKIVGIPPGPEVILFFSFFFEANIISVTSISQIHTAFANDIFRAR